MSKSKEPLLPKENKDISSICDDLFTLQSITDKAIKDE